LLGDPRVQSSFLTTDADSDTAFNDVPFATMTLLSNKRFHSKVVVDSVFRTELPSRYGRDALCVNIRHPAEPGSILRLLNVHLDSLHSQFRRTLQIHVLADLLREPGCKGGIVASDFNAILHGSKSGPDGGATWGVGAKLEDGLEPGRLDKVVMLGLQPNEIKILQPGLIGGNTRWNDHCGLHCTFTL
ncbi:hypothetical protein J132_03116, partial [Termitomyces sp. J132]